jgi:hypothetical protein
MQIALPQSDAHPQVRLTIKTLAGEIQVTTDDSHRFHEIELPRGVAEEEVEVLAEFCDKWGQPDPRACQMILKEREEPTHVHDGSQTEPDEDEVRLRLEDSPAESGSEDDLADAEDEQTDEPEAEVAAFGGKEVADGKEDATDREPSEQP